MEVSIEYATTFILYFSCKWFQDVLCVFENFSFFLDLFKHFQKAVLPQSFDSAAGQ